MPKGTFWTSREEYILLQGVSIYGLDWFQRKTGRSLAAVNAKARRIYGAGGLTRGAYTLREASRRTGYHTTQLRRAMHALRQKWKRTSPRGSFLIYEEQLEELVAWLKTDYWDIHHRLYCCLWCDTDKRPHYAQGLCRKCYQRYTRRLHREGLPLSSSGLLEVVQRNADSMIAALVTEIEKHLSKGRAPTERALARLVQCNAVM